jgi:hypothetical protein
MEVFRIGDLVINLRNVVSCQLDRGANTVTVRMVNGDTHTFTGDEAAAFWYRIELFSTDIV